MGKQLATLAIALLLLLSLAGCGGTRDYGEEDHWYNQTIEEPVEEEVTEAPPFTLAYYRDGSFDPITCEDGVQFQLTSLLYEPLFQLDESFVPQNWLCDSYTVSEDGLVWELHLRDGVLFSDGSELSASDVVETLLRAKDSVRYGSRLSVVTGIRRVSDDTVRLTLRSPHNGLPSLLEIPVVKKGTEQDAVPVGTGPYLYITDGESVYLSANESWWKGETLPVSRINMVAAKDSETVRYLFTSKTIHVFGANLMEEATLVGSLDTFDLPTTVFHYLGVNTQRETLQSAGLRRAISKGIHRNNLVDGYLSGHGIGAEFPVSPVSSDYPLSLAEGYSYESFYEAAVSAGLTAEAPLRLEILVNEESSTKVSMANSIAKTLSVFGLSVTVRTEPWAEFMEDLQQGNFDLYLGEIKLTADFDIRSLVTTGGSLNYGGYQNSYADSLLQASFSSQDREAALLSYYRNFATEVPIIPLCFESDSLVAHSDTITELYPTASNLFYRFWDWNMTYQSGSSVQTPS